MKRMKRLYNITLILLLLLFFFFTILCLVWGDVPDQHFFVWAHLLFYAIFRPLGRTHSRTYRTDVDKRGEAIRPAFGKSHKKGDVPIQKNAGPAHLPTLNTVL